MAVRKQSVSLEPHAAEYLAQLAKRLKRSVSSVLSDIVTEAARMDALDRVLAELDDGTEIPQKEVEKWLKKLGAA